ncbi:MAG: carbohydrate-binding domain-containing protein [Prevotella sp.]|nr:carbohydrate-binding domain-containing protein [Prevotella sp.]
MKRIFSILLITALSSCLAMAQRALMIKHTDGVTDAVSTAAIDSLEFSEDGSMLRIASREGRVVEIGTSGISLSYGEMLAEFTVTYSGPTATVTNPFLLEGVTATASGADVTVNNSNVSNEYSFTLTGETADGSFLYNGDYKATFILNGVSITSTKGAAIDIECGKRIAIELKKGTVNTLADCSGGKQKAALYCKGHIEIDKSGTLNVTGNTKHAISAKEYIQLKKSEGNINILGAASDGIHCGQYFLSNGYTVNIRNIGGDGIQAEFSGDDPYEEDYTDGSLTIQGGTYNIEVTGTEASAIKADTDISINSSKMPTHITIIATGDDGRGIDANGSVTISDDGTEVWITNSGAASKGVKVGNSENSGTFTLNGGTLTANISGTMVLEDADASYCAAIKTGHYVGNGGVLNVTATTGQASRAISADESIFIANGEYTIQNSCDGQAGTSDNYTAKAITCDKDIIIEGGTFDIKMSGTGGKGLKADGELVIGKDDGTGPLMKIATTGSMLSGGSTTGGTQPGGNRPGGHGGNWGGGASSSSGSSPKAIKAEGAAYVKGGSLYVTTAADGGEGLESKTSVTISGGTHYFQCYDDCINSAGKIIFAGGTTVCAANGNDAVDSNYGKSGAITISGGNVLAYSTTGAEEGLDCDNSSYIVVTGGITVTAGGRMGSSGTSSIGTATQGYYLGSSPSSYSSANYYTLCNTSGEAICTYKFASNVSNSLGLLTAPNLGKGSISVKSGTAKPTAWDINVNDVFFINPTVITSSTAATVTAK